MISFAILILVILLIGRRNVGLGRSVYVYRGSFFEDRYVECLCMVSLLFLMILTMVLDFHHSISWITTCICLCLVGVITFWDYRKNKIGIYSNGILLRSNFLTFDVIYTYRSYDLKNGKIKLRFYVRKPSDRQKLDTIDIVFEKEIGEKWEKMLPQFLERGKAIDKKINHIP